MEISPQCKLSSEQIVTSTIQQIIPKISLNSQQKIRNLTPQIPCFRNIGSPEQALGEYLNQTGEELKKEAIIHVKETKVRQVHSYPT